MQIKTQNGRHNTFQRKHILFSPSLQRIFKKHLKERGVDNQAENKAELYFPMYFWKSHFAMLV